MKNFTAADLALCKARVRRSRNMVSCVSEMIDYHFSDHAYAESVQSILGLLDIVLADVMDSIESTEEEIREGQA